MFYYMYEIRNILNNKVYVGVHKTVDLNDGYMGSGKVIKRAIEKHGIENFTKIILEIFDNPNTMYAREKEIVTEEFLLRNDTYNLRRGGTGGFDYINLMKLNVDICSQRERDPTLFSRSIALAKIGHKKYRERIGPARLREISRKGAANAYKKHGSVFSYLNKDPSFQQKRKEKFKEIKHAQGEKNSQFGTMWITDDRECKKIKKTDSVPSGWRKGRII